MEALAQTASTSRRAGAIGVHSVNRFVYSVPNADEAAAFFYYVGDPWGSFAEYSFGIDHVPHDVEWKSGDYPPEDSFYLWGPAVPDYFVINHESATTQQLDTAIHP